MIGVISWNIQWGRGADGTVKMSRVIDEIRRLGDFDVICLQEVADCFPGLKGGEEEAGASLLKVAFPDHALIDAFALDRAHPAGGRSRFGNVILSRLPVEAITRHRMPSPPDAGCPSMPRSVAEAVLRVPGGRALRVLSTHLEYYSSRQRAAQVAYLRQLQQEALDWAQIPPHPKENGGPFARAPWPVAAILCGDFNCAPASADWRALQEPAGAQPGVWTDAWTALHGASVHPHSVGVHGAEWPEKPYCCDFFFASTDALAALRAIHYDASSAASDHQPVMLELEGAALPPL